MALGCAILLLLPGGCFLFVGTGAGDPQALMIGAVILLVASVLFGASLSGPRGAALPPSERQDGNEP
jgi:hypothetical protein